MRRYPIINDITTTPENPPEFRGARKGAPYPPGNAPLQKQAYPDLAPLRLSMPPDRAFTLVRQVAAAMPRWKITADDVTSRYVEAVAITPILRFRDDVIIEVRAESSGCTIHLRSRSRLGRGDLGCNAARIREFLRALQAKIPD